MKLHNRRLQSLLFSFSAAQETARDHLLRSMFSVQMLAFPEQIFTHHAHVSFDKQLNQYVLMSQIQTSTVLHSQL